MDSVVAALARRASIHPERAAIIAGDRHVSYGELWSRVSSAAVELQGCGVRRGDRVLLTAPSTPAFAYGYFATHLAGAVAIPLDPHMPAARRAELIGRAAPRLAFAAKAEGDGELGGVRAIGELAELPPRNGGVEPPPLDDLADLLFTTGTTGRPKGVRLTHGNLAAAAEHINSVIGNREGDVEVMPLPLCHSFGLGRLRCNLVAGGTVVLVDGFRLPGEVFAALERHRAAGLVGVPAGFAVLLRFGARGLGPFAGQLRYVEIGSAPMPLEHKRQLMELLPRTSLWMHYGLTEASRSAFIEFHRHRSRLDTVGKPAPGVRIDLRTESGAACAAGETGLVWLGGPHVSPGYWDDVELSTASFAGGWVCSGDLGQLTADGFLLLHGRRDDMINVGGFNVSPEEVERVLCEHPAVGDAACIGVPDPRHIAGQVVRACLVAGAGNAEVSDEELARWVAARLEPYKVPAQYRWTGVLPRTASGKLVRATLRREAQAER